MTFDPANPPEIVVTQAIIDASIRRSDCWCMVTVALMEAIPEATRPQAALDGIRFTVDGVRYISAPSSEVARYIVAYDDGATIKPFKVRMRQLQVISTRTTRRAVQPRVADTQRKRASTTSARTRLYGARMLRVNAKAS